MSRRCSPRHDEPADPQNNDGGGWAGLAYSITLIDSGGAPKDTLPDDFSHWRGTSVITTNKAVVSASDSFISCWTLTWAGLQFPFGRSDSYWGIQTILRRHCDSDTIDYVLDSAAELKSGDAHVTQLLDCTDSGWHGVPEHIRDSARAHDLLHTPVIRLALGHGTRCGRSFRASPVRET